MTLDFSSFEEALNSIKKDVIPLRNALIKTTTRKEVLDILKKYRASSLEEKNEILMRGMGIWKTTDDNEQDRFDTLCLTCLDKSWIPMIN